MAKLQPIQKEIDERTLSESELKELENIYAEQIMKASEISKQILKEAGIDIENSQPDFEIE